MRSLLLVLAAELSDLRCGLHTVDAPAAPPAAIVTWGKRAQSARSCYKRCTKEQPCGDTCISRRKTYSIIGMCFIATVAVA